MEVFVRLFQELFERSYQPAFNRILNVVGRLQSSMLFQMNEKTGKKSYVRMDPTWASLN